MGARQPAGDRAAGAGSDPSHPVRGMGARPVHGAHRRPRERRRRTGALGGRQAPAGRRAGRHLDGAGGHLRRGRRADHPEPGRALGRPGRARRPAQRRAGVRPAAVRPGHRGWPVHHRGAAVRLRRRYPYRGRRREPAGHRDGRRRDPAGHPDPVGQRRGHHHAQRADRPGHQPVAGLGPGGHRRAGPVLRRREPRHRGPAESRRGRLQRRAAAQDDARPAHRDGRREDRGRHVLGAHGGPDAARRAVRRRP